MAYKVRCCLCDGPIVWHPGNGGQWIGSMRGQDWVNCFGIPDGATHVPLLPDLLDSKAVTRWLMT